MSKKNKHKSKSPSPAVEVKEIIAVGDTPVKEAEKAPEKETADNKKEAKRESKIAAIKEIRGEVKEVIDDALDENADELATSEPETVTSAANISLRSVASAVFGFVILVFAVIGIIATSNRVVNYIKLQSDDTRLVKSFESLVLPLTVFDSAVFEDTSVLSEDVIITAACWDAILNPSVTFSEDGGNYIVSYLDIDARVAKLFGTGLEYAHKTVGDVELLFEYDEETRMYTLPAYPKTVAYLPALESYEKTEAGYELRVKYVYPITTVTAGKVPTEKIMIYTVEQRDLGYVITSLKIGEVVIDETLD